MVTMELLWLLMVNWLEFFLIRTTSIVTPWLTQIPTQVFPIIEFGFLQMLCKSVIETNKKFITINLLIRSVPFF